MLLFTSSFLFPFQPQLAQLANLHEMPPPVTPAGRKATPGGGRGSRRGQGTTPRSRKPRASNKLNQGGLKTIFPITSDPSQFSQQFQHQQHQIIMQQPQPQQQHAGFPKSVTISGVLNPPTNQYDSISISNMPNNIPQCSIATSSSSITSPKVVVVSSASSPITSATSTLTTKPIMTQITTGQATQILRQNLMSVSVPSSVMSFGGSMRLPNIPQVLFLKMGHA